MKTARSLNVRKHGRSGLPDTAESGQWIRTALDEVERLAAMIPPVDDSGASQQTSRRSDAQRIENGMKRAVMLFERAEYWEERARSALLHAKYKERPDVRWRGIRKKSKLICARLKRPSHSRST